MSDCSELESDADQKHTADDHLEPELEDSETKNVSARKKIKYSKELLQQAVNTVKTGTSCSEAARQFHIPRQTLSDHIKGKYSSLNPSGRPPTLNRVLETELSLWVKDCTALGDPQTPKQFLKTAGKLSSISGNNLVFKNGTPSHTYIKSFLKRNKDINIRKPQALTRAAANVTPFNVKENIRNIRQYLIANGFGKILNDPKQFGNGDETGYALNPTPRKVLATVGSKAYRVESSNPKENVTVFNCVLASGDSLNPQVILKESNGTIVDVARACGGRKISLWKYFEFNILCFQRWAPSLCYNGLQTAGRPRSPFTITSRQN